MYVMGGGQPDGANKQSTELHDPMQRFPTAAAGLHEHMGYMALITVVTPLKARMSSLGVINAHLCVRGHCNRLNTNAFFWDIH